jgi:hypothetical protein
MDRLDQARAKMLAVVGEQLVRHEMFTIDWQFSSGRGLSSASFDEMADVLHAELGQADRRSRHEPGEVAISA